MYKLEKSTNAVYSLHYHLISVVKYRRKIFVDEQIISALKDIVEKVSEEFSVKVIEQECGDDHIHILFSAKPTLDFKSYIQSIKGRSARYLRAKFPNLLKDKLWGEHLWSPSYFLATTGNVTIDVLKKYIENQRAEQDEQSVQIQDLPE